MMMTPNVESPCDHIIGMPEDGRSHDQTPSTSHAALPPDLNTIVMVDDFSAEDFFPFLFSNAIFKTKHIQQKSLHVLRNFNIPLHSFS